MTPEEAWTIAETVYSEGCVSWTSSAGPGLRVRLVESIARDVLSREEEIAALRQEKAHFGAFIASRGYTPCSSAACNCGSFHGGHAEERLAALAVEAHEVYELRAIVAELRAKVAK